MIIENTNAVDECGQSEQLFLYQIVDLSINGNVYFEDVRSPMILN